MTKHTPEPLAVTTTDHQPPGYPAALICFQGGRGSGWEVIAPNVSSKAVADEIAAAYNATYAAGINPEAVGDLMAFAQNILADATPGPHPRIYESSEEIRNAAQAVLAKAKEIEP